MKGFSIKGDICYSEDSAHIGIIENGYAVCENGESLGVYKEIPEHLKDLPCYNYSGKLILPGMVDLHVHAPQYPFRGLGMDLELMEWLNTHTFPEEKKYEDINYAKKAYAIFVEDLLNSATTRACVFGTRHRQATILLMKMMEDAGLCGFVGKVNMDRNSPKGLCEENAHQSALETETWIEQTQDLKNVRPIITPRFIPTCSDELMDMLSQLQKKYRLPVQSHLSENLGEIELVAQLCPEARFYGDAYHMHGLFGKECPTVMAHCVHSGEEELQMIKEQGVFIAHCPESNTNLSSGIAPVRKFLAMGIKTGLGTDVAAGSSLSMFHAMEMAIQCSKLRWRLEDQTLSPLTVEEAFYLATKGGGAFFGKVGSLEKGYEFDAVVIDDSRIRHPQKLSVRERLERLIYLRQDAELKAKYVKGRQVLAVN